MWLVSVNSYKLSHCMDTAQSYILDESLIFFLPGNKTHKHSNIFLDCDFPSRLCDSDTKCFAVHEYCDKNTTCEDGADEGGSCGAYLCLQFSSIFS